MITAGRREQHKAATRQALQTAALRLFQQHGYAQTTVRDIAQHAGVTERTFFRYFPSKEDLVIGELLDLIPVLAQRVRDRPAGEVPYVAVHHALLDLAAERTEGLAVLFSGPPARFLARPRRARTALLEFEDGLAAALGDRLRGTGRDEPTDTLAFRASVLARASVAAMRAVLIRYTTLPGPDRTPQRALELLGEAFAAL